MDKINSITRKCNSCCEIKLIEDFTFRRENQTYKNSCKKCACLKSKKWRKNHPNFGKERWENNKEKLSFQWKLRKLKNPKQYLLTKARTNAKEKKVPFDLQINDINIPEYCPVLGLKLFFNDKRPNDNSPSIDRLIPKLGYVKNNIKIISKRANELKSNASIYEIESIIKYLENN